MPPPAYWHFLTPRDPASSRALRAVTDAAVRRLLRAGTAGADLAAAGAAGVGSGDGAGEGADDGAGDGGLVALPGVTDPRIREGVHHAVRLAMDILRRRRELSHRVAVMRSGPVVELPDPVPDTRLVPALHGLLPEPRPYEERTPQPQPASPRSPPTAGICAARSTTRRGRSPCPPPRPSGRG
ncbi:hypothetical protein FM076_30920 [Streptomyces albus subsp. chlorinus]|uniref:hypothetical protein n=1 Tax=Streptomyces albus TaxID=1888 RepID=UPI0015D48B75|nr:hypothetical protein [Streptomyces albus]NSC25326.1 hypothetical protein [Streptomyces albus subsp. chlorinus]